MKKNFILSLMLGAMTLSSTWAADYGLPAGIQEGNILHCFNWTAKEVKEYLPKIAEAGFGSVQLSPLQRPDARVGESWHALYRPYDLAFKTSSFCSEQDLKDLCDAAAGYGIKIIVDVVANHVDATAGYHDPWWDSNGRVRWNGTINYGDRYSITHGQLGDYGDVNSESAEVIAKGKAYVEKLKSLGVKGCRWDAAKHIGLPSEGCNFWSSVTSVPGMWHYGEILDAAGPNKSIIKEYTTYMSVTDNQYCDYAARDNGGIPGGHAGDHVANQGCPDTKMVYWAESHDTYSNPDGWSSSRDQATIDRAYAAYASRNGATALYLARPTTTGFNNIKVGKGTTVFTAKHIAEVNKFRNIMVGKADWFETNGNACSVTRKDGGAVIVMKGSGNVSVKNGGGYCPAGTYKDRVSGGTFTVTSSTISGNVGSSGIAVLYNDGITPPIVDPDDPIDPPVNDAVTITGDYNLAYNGDKENVYWWPGCPQNYPGVKMDEVRGSDGKTYKVAKVGSNISGLLFNTGGDANKTGDLTYSGTHVMNDQGATSIAVTFTSGGGGDDPIPPIPPVTDGEMYLLGDFPDSHWVPADAKTMPGSGNVFSIEGVELAVNPQAAGATTAYFSIAAKKGATWDDVNAGDRYGAATKDEPISAGSTVSVTKYPVNVSASSAFSWSIAPGTYDLTFDMNSMKLTVTEAGGPRPAQKPVVTANPAGGTVFSDDVIYVTLSVTPEADIYYNVSGPATTSSRKYTGPIAISETTTLSTLAITAEGAQNAQTFSYTKRGDDPIPPVGDRTNLITEYYKVNPNGQSGTNRTVTMNFNGQKSTTALSNWSESDLIAQGVARDVCQAIKGKHERPIVDSYALYAAYDSQNLYLGVQYVYTVWDLWGEGKQPGESKPYNMDGKLCLAFDLDPNKSFEGLTNEGGSIWQDGVYTTFDNGSDAWWYGSTKPGAGTPGYFVPNANGICDYADPNSCKVSTVKYGYADGLLPSIQHVYGQAEFEYDPALLEGNTGFVDLRSEIDDSAHTFYEYTIPLSLLGVTESYIKNTGIGVMVVDLYGDSGHSSLPYDPSFFDNVTQSYSKDPSSSMEKEDKDVVTYSHARIGKMPESAIELPSIETEDAAPVYYNLQGVRVENPEAGLYIVVKGNKVSKQYIR